MSANEVCYLSGTGDGKVCEERNLATVNIVLTELFTERAKPFTSTKPTGRPPPVPADGPARRAEPQRGATTGISVFDQKTVGSENEETLKLNFLL
ncbi:hypothetical protein FQA47_023864 [Oryzias melastigma]|uniref:Uncharacterized protein n=1 Tax=Oryzias melastigma TaxID=30732 RepID=A0A834C164_ORYME|nr:hypothetical protein FQA47_023864 [Oryzias melastigma]